MGTGNFEIHKGLGRVRKRNETKRYDNNSIYSVSCIHTYRHHRRTKQAGIYEGCKDMSGVYRSWIIKREWRYRELPH